MAQSKRSNRPSDDISTKTSVAMMGRSRFYWMLLPEELRKAILKAIGEVSVILMKRLTEYAQELQTKDKIAATFLTTLFVARFNKLGKFAISRQNEKVSSPIEYLFTTGVALDELYFPEDMIWLCGKVPTRVWWWLVIDPIKRRRFFEFIREQFPDPIPVERRVNDENTVVGDSNDAENAVEGHSERTEQQGG
jgi:hypothetical protein